MSAPLNFIAPRAGGKRALTLEDRELNRAMARRFRLENPDLFTGPLPAEPRRAGALARSLARIGRKLARLA